MQMNTLMKYSKNTRDNMRKRKIIIENI